MAGQDGFADSFGDDTVWSIWASTAAQPLGRQQVGPGMAGSIHTPLLYMHKVEEELPLFGLPRVHSQVAILQLQACAL